jgi:hypothetical protein
VESALPPVKQEEVVEVVRTWDNATKERYRMVAPDGTKINHEEDFYLSTHEHYGMWRSHYWSHVLARLASERHISGLSICLASGEHLIKIFMNVYKRKENLDPSMSRSSRLPRMAVVAEAFIFSFD